MELVVTGHQDPMENSDRLLVLMVLSIAIVANRSIPAMISGYLALDDQSYWYRMLIWHYGSASALNHPLFGVGLNDWERPEWMPASIDNFGLFYAVHYGLPAPFLLLLAFLSIFLTVGFKKGLDNKTTVYRTAFMITMTAFFMVGWTVHFWDAAYVLFLFLMGSGVWILDVETKERAALRGCSNRRLHRHVTAMGSEGVVHIEGVAHEAIVAFHEHIRTRRTSRLSSARIRRRLSLPRGLAPERLQTNNYQHYQ